MQRKMRSLGEPLDSPWYYGLSFCSGCNTSGRATGGDISPLGRDHESLLGG